MHGIESYEYKIRLSHKKENMEKVESSPQKDILEFWVDWLTINFFPFSTYSLDPAPRNGPREWSRGYRLLGWVLNSLASTL